MRAPRFPNPDPLSDHVLFIDGEAVIVNKPAGLPVATPRVPALSVELQLAELRFGFERPPSIVHRLDQDTSGCLLLARNPKAHKRFAAAFETGDVTKRYIAIVDGIPDEDQGVIDLPLGKVSSAREGWRMVVDERGKACVTKWKRLAVEGSRALIEFSPETGRTHQLRVHAASGLGMPITGDPVYGRAAQGLMLHASYLSIKRGEKPNAEATAPWPDRFSALGFAA
jgi:tRNA pseudouridine32 synthase / 23S rRNA pseudouridine746 synthase